MSMFGDTVRGTYNRNRARQFADEALAGITHAGIALVALDSGRVLLAQRTYDETDDPEVRETWEFPGGGLNKDEPAWTGAEREFAEETGLTLPGDSMVVNGWQSDDGVYQGFVVTIGAEFSLDGWTPTDEVQAIDWFDREKIEETENLRPEVRDQTDWDKIFGAVSGNEESDMADDDLSGVSDLTGTEPLLSALDLAPEVIPIHGVLAPENAESGDARGFAERALTRRPLRLPFGWQRVMQAGHNGAVTIGSIDRMMRKDGLIHWEGSLILSVPEADEFIDLLVHFGRYGVSIDGDKGVLDSERSKATGMTWFEAARIAGATACAIPAFAEAWVALGPHPDMPEDFTEDALVASGLSVESVAGARSTFDRGPGWVTNPRETKRLHDYWTKKGEPGYAKIAWGTGGDYRRCITLVGEKIGKNSPEDLKYMKRICAQWHHDALGYWPGDLDMPGNDTTAESRAKRKGGFSSMEEAAEQAVAEVDGLEVTEDEGTEWEAVLVSSAAGGKRPPLHYFHRHPDTEATVIEDPDEDGFQRTYGYAAEWGVCHIGFDNRCVEPPRTYSDDYPEFHLGRTKVATEEGVGYIHTGLLTYAVKHRDAKTILSESPEQAHFDNIKNAWASVRIGEDERGIWFSGVVLPKVPAEDLVTIEASGQVSGEWKHGALRALLSINVPGFPVVSASAEYDEDGNVVALVASTFGNTIPDSPCEPTPAERMAALAAVDAEVRMSALRAEWGL